MDKVSSLGSLLTAVTFILFAQTTQTQVKNVAQKGIDPIPAVSKTIPVAKVKDSIITATTSNVAEAVKIYSEDIPKKQAEVLKYKQLEQKALSNFIKAITDYVRKKEKTKKVILASKEKVRAEEDEYLVIKDSTCTNSTRPLFGKRKCTKWEYSYHLVDSNGDRINL